jgi:hypothetical protein
MPRQCESWLLFPKFGVLVCFFYVKLGKIKIKCVVCVIG